MGTPDWRVQNRALALLRQPRSRAMFSLIAGLFQKFTCLMGPKVGGTPALLPRRQYYAVSGRAELAQNGGPQGSDGPQVYDAPYMHMPYNNSGPDMQTVNELGVSGRALYGV